MKLNMKFIILVDEGTPVPDDVIEKIGRKELWFVDTKTIEPENEYRFLYNTIGGFSKTDRQIMIIKFSGREEIANRLGDECTETIVYLTNNKENKYYIEEYINTFLDVIDKFKEIKIDVRT